jgi:prepilin-type N-terminal cleavage/methylation domain-containing protein
MLNNLKQRKNEGFTIIEVMIVLAIAGLIMVIVFLAVPALQRNSRNTALNTDANNILSGLGEYASNNGGNLPKASTDIGTFTSGATSLTIGSSATGVNQSVVKLGGNVTAVTINTAAALSTSANIGAVEIVTGTTAKCNDTGTGLNGAAGARSYALLYVAESANGKILKCIGG